MSQDIESEKAELYAVYVEAKGHEKPLLQLELNFARLIDDIIVPYQTGEAFFVDGAPLTAEKITRIKVLKLSQQYARAKLLFDRGLTTGDAPTRKVYGEQYNTRFEHILRENSEDVTSQVLKAFNQVIKPSIKDYLPKREELISAATKIFIEGIKALNS
jgi:hypothetical protein